VKEPNRYRAKPVEVQAAQWNGRFEDLPTRWRASDFLHMSGKRLVISTPHGPASPEIGDYVAHGTAGEFYPVARAIFEYKYASVED